VITKPQKLDALTSLRFFAAAMIVLVHSNPVFGSMSLADSLPLDQGVSFFFVLSGFILAYNYPVLVGEADILTFLKARIARIWPAHLAAIALLVILTAHLNVGRESLSSAAFAAVANLFLFQSLIPVRKVFFAFNPVAWSISTEMFFYFAFPLLMAKSFFSWRFKLGLLAAVVILHLWFVAAWDIPFDSMSLKSASVEGLIYINPAVRVFEFFSGVLAYFGFTRLRPYVNYSELAFTVLEVGGIALTLVVMYYCLHLPAFINQESGFGKIISFYLHKSGSFWMFAVLIMVFAFGKGGLTKLLSFKPMILLGEISFALYLVHRTVLEWYQINAVYFEHLPQWSIVIGYWLLALLVAYLLHKIIENPCRKLLIAFPKLTVAEVFKTLFTGRQGVYVALMTVIITAMLNLHVLLKLEPCPPVLCQKLAQQHPLSPPAVFGDYVELTALHLSANEVELLFKVQQPLPIGYSVAVDVIAADGSTVEKTDTLILKARYLMQGEQWLERIKLPADSLKQGTKLGIAIHSKSIQLLNVSYPKMDNDGKRALIDFAAIHK
jgi:peptidoglycan/LPS O-acetylase OafA/YrhL